MIIVNHRVNTLEKLRATPIHCGVEIDIRPRGRKLILHHDPYDDGPELDTFLREYKHRLLILNIKSEGIEKDVLKLVHAHNIKEYFLLDVTPPFMFKLIAQGESNLAVRYSEFESIETCRALIGKVTWVFVDNLTRLPIEGFTELQAHFKLCVVSPELLGRHAEVPQTKETLAQFGVDAILTDHPERWQ